MFRHNCHLRLCYLLIYVYMGRPFIFYEAHEEPSDDRASSSTSNNPNDDSPAGAHSILVNDCVQSALEILDTLQSLSDHTGLCRASYTEFSSCRAALLVLLAQQLNSQKRTKKLHNALTRGMILIRQMTGGSSSESEISLIESLETAIHHLSSLEEGTNEDGDLPRGQGLASAYARFKNWTEMLKNDSSLRSPMEISSFSPRPHWTPGSDVVGGGLGLFDTSWSRDVDAEFDPTLFSIS